MSKVTASVVSVVITLIVMLVASVNYVNNIERNNAQRAAELEARMAVVEQSVKYNREIFERIERDVKGRLDKIDSKLDRIIRER